jgi:transcriptional regulator with XRE-family HTH domain
MTRNTSEFDVGARLASLRAGRGQSQSTTARLAELSPAYLSRIESGHVHPTFATVLRVLDALRADLPDLRAADDVRPRSRPACPVTAHGGCLLELTRAGAEVARADGRETYTLREIQILRDLAAFMRSAAPERVRAIEMLLQELLRR